MSHTAPAPEPHEPIGTLIMENGAVTSPIYHDMHDWDGNAWQQTLLNTIPHAWLDLQDADTRKRLR